MIGFFSNFLFQSIRVTHESSAQEGQTEVCIEFKIIFALWGCFCQRQHHNFSVEIVCKLCRIYIYFLSVAGPKFRWESGSAFYSFRECRRTIIWARWANYCWCVLTHTKYSVGFVTLVMAITLIAHSAVIWSILSFLCTQMAGSPSLLSTEKLQKTLSSM